MPDVRFGSKADMCGAKRHVRFTPNSDRESEFPQTVMFALKRTRAVQLGMSAMGHKRTSRHLFDRLVGAGEECVDGRHQKMGSFLPIDLGSRLWHRNAHADSLSSVMKHI